MPNSKLLKKGGKKNHERSNMYDCDCSKDFYKKGGDNVIKSPILFTIREKDNPVFKFINEMSPVSGYEPEYKPEKWNNVNIIKNHNCYSYMMNAIASGRDNKPQPGYFSGFDHISNDGYTCDNFFKRMKKDNPSIYKTGFDNKCKKGHYKAFMAIANDGDDPDYHFYRQDKNGYWSHKPGRREAVNIDASDKKIKNPLLADRNYTHYNYNKPCSFFCVNPKVGRVYSGGKKKTGRGGSRGSRRGGKQKKNGKGNKK